MLFRSTDTGDILGLIKKFDQTEIPNQKITENLEKIKSLKEQKYPWFSAKTFAGLKLFDHFKKRNTDIERPAKDVEIKNLEILEIENVPADKIKEYIFENIKKVKGDFRQKEILDCWQKYFENSAPPKFQIFKIKILVTTGTYIRAFTDEFDFLATLLKLNRTDIKI